MWRIVMGDDASAEHLAIDNNPHRDRRRLQRRREHRRNRLLRVERGDIVASIIDGFARGPCRHGSAQDSRSGDQ
jgi:hypothetical protein